MASFYVVLPSNVAGGSISNFTVKLPDRIKLEGEWEVGLVEISYQNTWYNVRTRKEGGFTLINIGEHNEALSSNIPQNNYTRISDLIRALMDEFRSVTEIKKWEQLAPVKIIYKQELGRVQVKTHGEHVHLFLSDRLSYMLGFDGRRVTKEFEVVDDRRVSTAKHPIDLKAGFYFMYIYCDLVSPQIVGDKFAPLLKTISVSSKFGDIVQEEFVNPHYVPVLKREFENIEINIKDDTGQFVPFSYGKTIIKLHFRKRRQ